MIATSWGEDLVGDQEELTEADQFRDDNGLRESRSPNHEHSPHQLLPAGDQE